MTLLYSLLIWGAILFSRPMVFGYFNATLGLAFFILAVVIAIFISIRRWSLPNSVYITATTKLLLTNLLLGTIYSILVATTSLDRGAKIAAIIWISSLCIFFSTINHRLTVSIIKVSRTTLRIIVFSGLITSVLFALNKYSIHDQALVLFEIPIKDRGFDSAKILVPLSTILNEFTSFASILPRSSYLMIEPGIAPALLTFWRILENSRSTSKNLAFDFIFILALATTLSTAAPIAATVYFVGRKLFLDAEKVRPSSIIIAGIIIIVGVIIFLYLPVFGYYEKQTTHGDSFTERADWYSADIGIRTETAILLLIYYLMVFPLLPREKLILIPVLYLTAVINVLAFTPLMFLTTSTLLALQLNQVKSQPKQRISEHK